jgi:hypothetical protein
MFDDDEDDFSDSNLNEDLEQFEAHLKGKTIGFLDSDRLEAIIDHYIINGQYSKAKSAADHGVYHFQYNPVFTLRKAQAMSGMGLLNDALELMNGGYDKKSNKFWSEWKQFCDANDWSYGGSISDWIA